MGQEINSEAKRNGSNTEMHVKSSKNLQNLLSLQDGFCDHFVLRQYCVSLLAPKVCLSWKTSKFSHPSSKWVKMCFVETSQQVTSFTVESCIVHGPDGSAWHMDSQSTPTLKTKKEKKKGKTVEAEYFEC